MSATLEGTTMICWPESWLKAAVKAGFAEQTERGSYRVFGGDEMRDKLQIFADAIAQDMDSWGFSHHECGEDCCMCLDPEPNVRCDVCNGKGGWLRCYGCVPMTESEAIDA